MERSKSTTGVSKGRHIDYRAQRHLFRCADPQSLMEDEDTLEERARYSYSVKATRSKQRERTFSGSMGRESWDTED